MDEDHQSDGASSRIWAPSATAGLNFLRICYWTFCALDYFQRRLKLAAVPQFPKLVEFDECKVIRVRPAVPEVGAIKTAFCYRYCLGKPVLVVPDAPSEYEKGDCDYY